MSDASQSPSTGAQDAVAVAAARVLEGYGALIESTLADSQYGSFLDPRDYGIGDQPGFGPQPPGTVPTWLDRRRKGEFIPAFLTESQLTWLRRRLRALATSNEIGQAVLRNRQSYAIGKGFKYKVLPKRPGVSPQTVRAAQLLVDTFCDYNALPQKESELLWRCDVEGEAFLRLFPRPNGLLEVRFTEPDAVKAPFGDNDSAENSFGIKTDKLDVATVRGYWIVTGLPDEQPAPRLVPPEQIVHIKSPETPSFSKRGLSPFFAVESNLRQAEDLLNSTVALAKNRAKIAMIRRMKGVSEAAARALLQTQSQDGATVTDPATGQQVSLEKYRYGSILTVADTTEIEFPSADIGASDHVAVYQMILRSVGALFCMPEYMISGDASNANYSSTMVAESPFVRSMERLQDYLADHLARRPYHPRSLIWRQLMHAAAIGMLPKTIAQDVEIQVEPPTLIVRDVQKEAAVDQIYNGMGIKSKTTIALEQGLDPEKEAQHLAREKQSDTGDHLGAPPVKGEGKPDEQPAPPGEDSLDAIFGEGFTGRKTDIRGRSVCYSDGKRVACGGFDDQHKRDAHGAIDAMVKNPGNAGPRDFLQAARALQNLTRGEVKEIAKKHGFRSLGGTKKEFATKVAIEAQRRVDQRQAYSRKARARNVAPAEMIAQARAIRRMDAEFAGEVSSLIKQARRTYEGLTGKRLTRNHPAFHGGDPSQLGSQWEVAARSVASGFPGLLGDAQDTTEAARRMFDYVLAGPPPRKKWAQSYDEAIEYLAGSGSSPRRPKAPTDDEVPF